MARFVDATGRPGPATWDAGSYPEGQENYPVTGVSWYEAAALPPLSAEVCPRCITGGERLIPTTAAF